MTSNWDFVRKKKTMKNLIRIGCGLSVSIFCMVAFAQITPPGGGNGCTNCPPYTNNYTPPPYVPGLKVSIPPLSGTNLFINLLEADPAGTYDVFAASNLVSAIWNDVLSGTNSQTNFILPFPFTDMGFFRAARMDTPVTNTAGMTVSFSNNFVNANLITANISGGPATAMAVLVNDTNLADALWIPFSAVPYVLLGTNDGTYEVEFGFIGSDGQTNWTLASVTLDTTPPLLFVISPTNNVATQPVIQLTGYSPEALSSISYDLTNAAGLFTNQDAGITDQFYSTNTWGFTTNYFEALDIPLTNGLNVITFHATDLAGNMTTTNFSFTLDYSSKTNPPMAQLTMPLDGMKIVGNSFTLRGQVADPTVTITASLTDTNGMTNTFTGLVERNGRFWLEDIPLSSGTNQVSIIVSDAADNVTVTNINLIQSSLALTMNPISDSSQLWQPKVSVGGNISDSSYAVWVNGVQGTNNGDGTWSAANVPTTPGGVAIFDVTAYPSSEAPSSNLSGSGVNPQTANAANTTTNNMDKPPRLYVENDIQSFVWTEVDGSTCHPTGSGWSKVSYDQHWNDGQGGGGFYSERTYYLPEPPYDTVDRDCHTDISWPTSSWPVLVEGSQASTCQDDDLVYPAPNIRMEHCATAYASENYDWDCGWDYLTYTRHAQTTMKLQTGGKAQSGRKNLFVINGSATKVKPDDGPGFVGPGGVLGRGQVPIETIPPTSITVDGKALGSDGNLYVVLPDNDERDVTPKVGGVDYYNFIVRQQKYRLFIQANTSILQPNRVVPLAKFCVGQQIGFAPVWSPSSPPNVANTSYLWDLSKKFVNHATHPCGSCSVNYDIDLSLLDVAQPSVWYVSGGDKNVFAHVFLHFSNGQSVIVDASGQFSMFRPQILGHEQVSQGAVELNTNSLPTVKLGMLVPGSDYIRWTTDVGLDTHFSANLFHVQLVDWESMYDPTLLACTSKYDGTSSQYWLDNSDPFSDGLWPVNPDGGGNYKTMQGIPFGDGPDISGNFCSFVQLTPNLKTYLCFQPKSANSIPITLERVEWSEHGRADLTSGIWTPTTSYITGPSFFDDDSFPFWEQIFHNTSGN
jgi:hypothetical protein